MDRTGQQSVGTARILPHPAPARPPEPLRRAAALHAQNFRRGAAISLYVQALQENPCDIAVLKPLVELYLATNRPDEAVEKLKVALTRDPRLAAGYHLLARVYRFWGREREALEALRSAIAVEPDNAVFYSALANIKRFECGDPEIGVMEDFLRRSLPVEVRVPLQFALAKAYADIGEDERAFMTRVAANADARAHMRYDERAYLEPYKRMAAAFSAELMQAKKAIGVCDAGVCDAAPIFILGVPRSGTTLVEQILASHSQAAGLGESSACGETMVECWPDYPAAASALTTGDARRLGETYLAKSRALAGAAEYITDKHLNNVLFAGLLHLVFPKARFVHVVRDPVDTCLSGFGILFAAGNPYAYDLAEAGRHYRAYETLMAHWHAVLPQQAILRLPYEDLVADLEQQARRLLAHCGLPWDPACLSFHKTERLVCTAASAQVRRPLYSTERFRPAPHLLQPLLEALG